MKLKDIEVKRITVGELPSILFYQLLHVYHVEQWDFVLMIDRKNQIMYVNHTVPEEDIQKFVTYTTYPGPYVNDPECPIVDISDYIFETYECGVYNILFDNYKWRQNRMEDARAEEQAAAIVPLIEKLIRTVDESDEPDLFNEALTYQISNAGAKKKHRTPRNLVGTSTKYVFYLGYLAGCGEIEWPCEKL